MGTLRILVLDDDPAKASALTTGLERRGAEVRATANPDEALRLALSEIPDLVVVDGTRSALGGVAVVRVLRTRPATALIPALFLGDRKLFEKRLIGFTLGADGFLPKPLDPRSLEEQVTRSLKETEEASRTVRPRAEPGTDFSVSPAMTAFRGTLEQVGLPSLLTLLEMEGKTGMLVLLLEPESLKARLHLCRGRLVRARIDGRESPANAELVYELLARTKGKFDFRAVAVDSADEIRLPTPTLLLEAARRIDETRRRALS